MMTVNQKNIKPGQQDDFLRIQDLLYLCLARWKWFVLSLVVTVGAATVHVTHSCRIYTYRFGIDQRGFQRQVGLLGFGILLGVRAVSIRYKCE